MQLPALMENAKDLGSTYVAAVTARKTCAVPAGDALLGSVKITIAYSRLWEVSTSVTPVGGKLDKAAVNAARDTEPNTTPAPLVRDTSVSTVLATAPSGALAREWYLTVRHVPGGNTMSCAAALITAAELAATAREMIPAVPEVRAAAAGAANQPLLPALAPKPTVSGAITTATIPLANPALMAA